MCSNPHSNMSKVLVVLFLQFYIISVWGDKTFFEKFNQQKFKLKDFRGELKSFNPKLVRKAEILTYKYNRSIAAVNGSFIYEIDIEENIQVIVQAYKFASNEYRTFPIHFQVNFCDAIKSNIVGLGKLLLCGNATKDCYFRKNVHYYVCNYFPDSSKFPPNIPSGQFMIETQLLYKEQELMVLDYYIEIYTPINY